MVLLREFRPGDEPALHRVFLSSIHEIAIHDYTQQQVNAWASFDLDQEFWRTRMQDIKPFVVEVDAVIVAYADLQRTGYIDHFFVSGSLQRRGAGRLLMERIHTEAHVLGLTELTSEVSRSAQPFFEHFGFAVVEQRSPVMRGVEIPNALMRKVLSANKSVESGPPAVVAHLQR